MRQGQLDSHLQEVPCKECVIPYTDALFREAAIEWLVATDQVTISYFMHRLSILIRFCV
jgi:hypothetical protein